jgi:serine/threonine protein kinase
MIDTVSHFTPEPDADIVEEKKTLIGEGSTSICYKVRYNGKWFSKKQLKPEYKNFQLYRSALRKEYELGSRIDCPYVVHYSDIGEDRDGPYILTDYVDGQPLSKFIDDNPDYFKSRHARKRFTDELFSAVECLHTHQILHLDLTPSNILITKIEHHVKLIDYGFSYQDSYTETTGWNTWLFGSRAVYARISHKCSERHLCHRQSAERVSSLQQSCYCTLSEG